MHIEIKKYLTLRRCSIEFWILDPGYQMPTTRYQILYFNPLSQAISFWPLAFSKKLAASSTFVFQDDILTSVFFIL